MLIKFKDLCKNYGFLPRGIIHVGAHELEELPDYIGEGVNKIIWIEGNPDIVEANKSKVDGIDQILLNALIWEEDGLDLSFNITNNLQSSSILKMDKHTQYHPHVTVDRTITLPSITLSSLLESIEFDPALYNFMNLDIQGVELRALKGFKKYLNGIDYIYTEVNSGSVYAGNDTIESIDEYLVNFGFVRVETILTDFEWGDAFYKKIENND
jgi:FkbM family methyltransferase